MSKLIHEAKLAEVKTLDDNSASFTVRPLYYGYGNTLGNSLRRVLLSSISGAAVIAFKIEGVAHEFTTIPGVQEDAIDISLNLKNIHLKSHSDKVVELTLEKKGAGPVKASDIKANADIEIVNPQQIICNIDDPKVEFKMTLAVDTGRGYATVEETSALRPHDDMVAIDAVFSPILRVRYNVSNTRVGDDSNLQELVLTIDTDGTLTPEEAFEEAAAILINQYSALAGETRVESAPAPTSKAGKDDSNLSLSIEDLGLSARTANALANNEIRTIRDLLALGDTELKDLKGFGAKALEEVKEKLMEFN
jgi:DNA-directed RNA polymerase subunit alpha